MLQRVIPFFLMVTLFLFIPRLHSMTSSTLDIPPQYLNRPAPPSNPAIEKKEDSASSGSMEKEKEDIFDFTLKPIGRKEIKLSDFKGKVIILYFWSSTCGPSIGGMDDVELLQRQVGPENIELLLISEEDEKKVQSFLYGSSLRHTYTYEEYPTCYLHFSIPATFIISKEGKLVLATEGRIDWRNMELVDAMKKLAGVKPKNII